MNPKFKIYTSFLLIVVGFFTLKTLLPENNCAKIQEEQFWYGKTYTKDKYDIVICGDSRVYRGVSTKFLLNSFPKNTSAFNLGYSSIGFEEDYLNFAMSLLKKESKNKYLVLGISMHSLTPNALQNEHLKSFQNKSSFEIYKKTELAALLCYFSSYKPLDLLLKNRFPNEYAFHSDGWVEYLSNNVDSLEAIESYLSIFNDNEIIESHLDKLSNQLKNISKKGVKIIAFRPPTSIQMLKLEDEKSNYDYNDFIERTNGFIAWIDLDFNTYETYDGSHLTSASAKKLSMKIGRVLLSE
ncbi:MAG: hypothetical protein COA33_009905 [Fluviicola sp.]|nr:hypothetical protein [Fluviicola sp.]